MNEINLYDVVSLINDVEIIFIDENESKNIIHLKKNDQGVIVDVYDLAFLVEFEENNFHVINKLDLELVWKNPSAGASV